jgi:hypothetical protein
MAPQGDDIVRLREESAGRSSFLLLLPAVLVEAMMRV